MRSCWILSIVSWYAVTVSCSFHTQNGTILELEKKCVLATPAIQFSPLQNTVQLETDMLKDGDKAWIGYAMEYVEFQYKGCATNLQTEDHKKVNTSLDLGQCYSACKGYTLFGLTRDGKSCRCLTEEILKEDLTQKDCTTLCDNQSFVCGSTTLMSIYERVFTELSTGKAKDIIHQCLHVSYIEPLSTSKYFSWTACSKYMGAMCIDQKGYQSKHKRKNTWSEGMVACFVAGEYPMPYEPIKGYYTMWLGVVLTIAITEYEAPENKADYRMYGYVEKENDTYLMKFTNSSLDINMTICKTDSGSTAATTTNPRSSSDIAAVTVTSMSTTTTESTLTHRPPPVTTMSNISTTSSSTSLATIVATINQTTTTTSTTEGINNSQDSQHSNVGVFVGVPVAILVLIGIICAVILLWRRRKQPKDAAASSKTHHNGAFIGDSSRISLENIVSDKREVDTQTTSLQPNGYELTSDVRSDDNYQNMNANTYVNIEGVRCDNQTPDVTETAVTSENYGDNPYCVPENAEKQPHYTPLKFTAYEDTTNDYVNHAGYSSLNRAFTTIAEGIKVGQ